nr:acyltransferase [Solirubrobacterales bacterium]
MPGLDGLRGVAVLAVIAYHLKIDWASGGLLGVGVFFTLSGYLITDILLERWSERRLVLKEFWLARARRLLPALFVVLIVVMAWVTIGNPAQLSTLRGETVASALFFSNWWFIFQDVSYFEQFGPPSPLGHIWSLGVEEQFYIFWPWILLAGLAVFGVGQKARRGVRQRVQPRLALATLGLALVSIILMAVLFTPGPDSTRAYEGTDTRAFGLLIGAALAMVWPSRRLVGKVSLQARNTLDLVGAVGLVSILILIATTDEFSPFIYRGGLVLLSIATAMVV